jgi:transposase
VQKIIEIKNKTHQEIANIYDISRSVITRIKNGTRWGLITGINNISAHKRRSL